MYGPSHSSLIFPVNWTQFPFIIFKSETLKVISTYFLLFSTSSFVSSNLPFFPIILFIVNPLQTLFQNLLKHQCLTFQILSNDLSFLSLFQTYTLTHLKYSSTKSKKKKKKESQWYKYAFSIRSRLVEHEPLVTLWVSNLSRLPAYSLAYRCSW